MKNFRIGKKLFVSYAVILILMIVGFCGAIMNLMHLNSKMDTFYDGPFIVNGSANKINANFERVQKATYRAISNTDPDITSEAEANVRDAAAIIEAQLPIVQKYYWGDPQIVANVEDCLNRLTPMREHVLSLARQNKNEEAVAYMETNNILVIREAQKELEKLIDSGDTMGTQLIGEVQKNQRRAIEMLALLGGASILISVLFGAYISRGITKAVKELECAARNIAQGNLSTAEINYESKDEMGSLANDMREMSATLTTVIKDETDLLNEMAKGNFDIHTQSESSYVGELRAVLLSLRKINNNLSDTLSQINRSAEQVAAGAEQVSSGAQMQAQGATEQAASVEALLTAINEISEQVGNNVKSARAVNDKSKIVRTAAEESRLQIKEMLTAMTEIGNRSKAMEHVIKTIEDIAFQTNILALNAGVEAARAGEYGRGFSVVANEIRSLASESTEAAKSTAALIKASLETVEQGNAIANSTAETMLGVAGGVGDITESIHYVTEASIRQEEAVRQIRKEMVQISSIVQSNSATAEESAAASEELSSQAQLLSGLVSRFRLKKTEHRD